MKFTKIFLIILICIFPFFSGVAQNQKMEFADEQKIFASLPEFQQAKKMLDSLVKKWQDEMEKMGQDLQEQYEEYQAKQGTMTDAAKKAKEQDLMKLQNGMQEFRTAKFGQTGELAMEQKKLLGPIQAKVREILKEQNKIKSH